MHFLKDSCAITFECDRSVSLTARKALGGAIISVYLNGRATKQYGLDATPLFGRLQFNSFSGTLAWPEFVFHGIESKLSDEYARQLCFEGYVSYGQLEAFEKERNGQDFSVRVTATLNVLNAAGSCEQWKINDERLRKPAQEWLSDLTNCGFKKYLFLEMAFPADAAADQDSALRHLLKARELFDKGLYRECVSALRLTEERLRQKRNDGEAIEKSSSLFKGRREERESMELSQRMLFLRNAVNSALNTGPHHGDVEEAFDRVTAKALLAMVSALVELYPEPSVASKE